MVGNDSPIVVGYTWSTATGFGTKYTNPSLPGGAAYSVGFNASGNAVAVGHQNSPYITVYPWTSGTGFGTKYSNPTITPTGGVGGVSFVRT